MDFNEQLFINVLCDYYLDQQKPGLKPGLLFQTTFLAPFFRREEKRRKEKPVCPTFPDPLHQVHT